MTASMRNPSLNSQDLPAFVHEACARIAPTWPLDRFIAVNPWWGSIHKPIEEIAAQDGVLCGANVVMPMAYYRELFAQGAFEEKHLADAIFQAGNPIPLDLALRELTSRELQAEEDTPKKLWLMTDAADAADAARGEAVSIPWQTVATHQISQYCAAYFDENNASWHPDKSLGLYGGWKKLLSEDWSVCLLKNESGILRRAAALPECPRALVNFGFERLGIPESERGDYATALLRSVNGWAAWCAYKRWEARLSHREDDHILELLCIRLAWEILLDDSERNSNSRKVHIREQWRSLRSRKKDLEWRQKTAWVCQRAWERADQDTWVRKLAGTFCEPKSQAVLPAVQAVFCIDVRSEIFRRAWESVDPGVQTKGFAGFFGLPLEYSSLGTQATSAQLPALLAPSLRAHDSCQSEVDSGRMATRRRSRLGQRSLWKALQEKPTSMFTFAESAGFVSAWGLIRKSFPNSGPGKPLNREGLTAGEAKMLRPRLSFFACESEDSLQERTNLAARVLHAMALTQSFARLVVLVGHGSQSANNAHASGLDCGACGGQTGEVNARALVFLLNDARVRERLEGRNIFVPPQTCFVAGLHNTTTDEVTFFDLDLLPGSHFVEFEKLQKSVLAAAHIARQERAPRLGLETHAQSCDSLLKAFQRRANNWAEVRPEWGLADNAALIVAPRARTRGVDLQGRAFLHDYNWRSDEDGSLLELIMTAPMVVAHWINMQYYAATVDNERYGSGNKVLHNVVGGTIGVFEGNGGDLRIGLPMQSLRNGEKVVHRPQRLSVFIEAPQSAIERVLHAQETVRHLVENKWLFLFQIDDSMGRVFRFEKGTSSTGGIWNLEPFFVVEKEE